MNSENISPEYSVVIPLYNGSSTIIRALESCTDQTAKPAKVIVVDNNSKDDGLSIVKEFSKYAPIEIQTLFELKPGANHARNKGLEVVSTKYVQFLDADDELKPQKISHQISIAEAEKSAVILGGYERDTGFKMIPNCSLPTELILFQSEFGLTSSLLFNLQWVKKVGGWNTELKSSQEFDLVFRILKSEGTVTCDNQVNTIIHSDASERISTSNTDDNAERFLILRSDMLHWMIESKNEQYHDSVRQFSESYFRAWMTLYRIDPARAKRLLNSIPSAYFKQLTFKSSLRKFLFQHIA